MTIHATRLTNQLLRGIWDYAPERESEVMNRAATVANERETQAFRAWMFAEFPTNRETTY